MNFGQYYQRHRFVTVCVFLVLVFLIAFVAFKMGFLSRLNTRTTCNDCSVIFVSLDTLSANNIPCYGYARNTSPNLCQFAKKHMLFANAFTNATYTLPSHTSMFTGTYPFQHGVNSVGALLDKSTDFLPEVLRNAGYLTMAVLPKNHSHLPKDTLYNKGIDVYYDEDKLQSWVEPLAAFRDNIEQGRKSFLFLHTYFVHAPYLIDDRPMLYPVKLVDEIPTTHSEVEELNVDVFDWMREHFDQLLEPHESSEDDVVKLMNFKELLYTEGVTLSELQVKADSMRRYSKNIFGYLFTVPNYYKKIQQENPDHIEFVRSLYDQKIHELDGTLLKDVISFYDQNKRIQKKVILVITADHGEELMEHGEMFHKTLYDSNTKVPLVLAHPSDVSARIVEPVQSVDIMPTILSLLGMQKSTKAQGIDLLKIDERTQDRLLIADSTDLSLKTIRWNQWKVFVRYEDGVYTPYEMYNYVTDPKEKNNVLFSNMKIAKDILQRYLELFGLQNGAHDTIE